MAHIAYRPLRFGTFPVFNPLFGAGQVAPEVRTAPKAKPAVNIMEEKDGFKLEVAAPGLRKEDFEVKVEGELLRVSAKRAEASQEGEAQGRYFRREFVQQGFEQSFRLPKTVDGEKISAAYENGILLISLPKKEEAKPQEAKLIEIS